VRDAKENYKKKMAAQSSGDALLAQGFFFLAVILRSTLYVAVLVASCGNTTLESGLFHCEYLHYNGIHKDFGFQIKQSLSHGVTAY